MKISIVLDELVDILGWAMHHMNDKKANLNKLWFILALLTLMVSGCSQQVEAVVPSDPTNYKSVLDVSYENDLDRTGQLALGILELAETQQAVTAEQSQIMLPLWQLLQGLALKSDAERLAVIGQIEAALTTEQILTIQSMRLTNADALDWLQSQGAGVPSGSIPVTERSEGGFAEMTEEQRAEMREQFAAMSGEDRAAFQVKTTGSGANLNASRGVSVSLINAVIDLLDSSDSSDEDLTRVENSEPMPTSTPVSTELMAKGEPEQITSQDIVSEDTVSEPSLMPEVDETLTIGTVPGHKTEDAGTVVQLAPLLERDAVPSVNRPAVLEQIPDTDPGPPFSTEITTNFIEPNPDLEQGWIYTVGGYVRNDSDQTYSLQAIHVTFYDSDGFHGAFYPFASSGRGRSRGGEYIWHGRTEADYACLLLGPGQTCAFSVQIAAADMGLFLVHPDATVVEWHEAIGVDVRSVSLEANGVGYVRVSGSVYNENPYRIKNVMLSGVLFDETGQWVSFGTRTLLEDIEPGSDAGFVIWLKDTPYTGYEVFATAERDFN
ncbi:MAG: hypothetical protein P1S60_04625 [Anaerolineae bacterium]|nr:hypothetical protein [Anaerolineae bacterium]